MNDQMDIPELPDYVSVEEASKRLGISKTRVYKYVNDGRLRAVKAAHTIMIPVEEIENYKRNITGRPRKSTPPWRIPPGDNDLHITRIFVKMLPNKESMLKKKLAEIKQSENYIFPGTIARYICLNRIVDRQVEIELVWRGASAPDEYTQKQYLEAFRKNLSEILDWSTAQYDESTVLMHT